MFSLSALKGGIGKENFTGLAGIFGRKRIYPVEKVPYAEISKMEGLLRCSTLPLERAK